MHTLVQAALGDRDTRGSWQYLPGRLGADVLDATFGEQVGELLELSRVVEAHRPRRSELCSGCFVDAGAGRSTAGEGSCAIEDFAGFVCRGAGGDEDVEGDDHRDQRSGCRVDGFGGDLALLGGSRQRGA